MWQRLRQQVIPGAAGGWRNRLALPGLLAALAGLHLASLLRTPPPHVDEAWYAARAWALIHTGRAFGVLDQGVLDRFPGYWTFFPWLGTWLQALAMRLLGPTLLAVRLVSLAFGLLLLGAVYVVGERLGGRRVGLVGVCLVAVSRAFLLSAHRARQDVMIAALGFTAVALHLSDRARSLSLKSLLSGLAVGLAFEIHPNAAVYGPALLALHLVDEGRRFLRSSRFWGFAAGLLLGLAFYAGKHILPYPQSFVAMARLGFGPTHTPPLLVPDPGLWLRALGNAAILLIWSGELRAPLAAATVAALALRRSPADRRLAALSATLFVGFAALIRNSATYYVIAIAPAAELAVASLLDGLLRQRLPPGAEGKGEAQPAAHTRRLSARLLLPRPGRTALGLLLALGCIVTVAPVPFSLAHMLDDPRPEFRLTLERIRQAVPSGSAVMGPQTYWFGLPEERYYSWEQLVLYREHVAGSSLEDAFRALGPQYLIIDRKMEEALVESQEGLSEYHRYFSLLRRDVEAFLARRAVLVAAVETQTFGRVRIYAIDWG